MSFLCRVGFALFLFFLGVGSPTLCAQITNSEASAKLLAGLMATESGQTQEQYMDHARSLARTLSLVSAAKQAEILTSVPSGAGGDDAGGGDAGGGDAGGGDAGGGDVGGGEYANAQQAIADSDLSPGELLDFLLKSDSVSETDLLSALQRDPPMGSSDVGKLLDVHGKVSNGVLVSSLVNAHSIPADSLKQLLIANSPLKPVVLNKLATTAKLSDPQKQEVLDAQ